MQVIRLVFLIPAIIFLSSCSWLSRYIYTRKADNKTSIPIVEMPLVTITPKSKDFRGMDTTYFKLIHTHLELRPEVKDRELYGHAELKLTPYAGSRDTLVLDASNFTIAFVDGIIKNKTTGKEEEAISMKYVYDNKKLRIKLPHTLTPKDTFTIITEYIACPDATVVSEGKDRSKRGLHFINYDGSDSLKPTQFWTQGETQYNCNWFPTIESTQQKSTYKVELTVDSGWVSFSNGELVYSRKNKNGKRTDVWISDKPFAPYLVVIAAGNWRVFRDTWRDSIPVNYYLEPKYFPYAKLIFGNTPQMLEFFSQRLGYDYPWQKFSQVVAREFVAGAMENTSAVVHFGALQHDSRSHLDYTYEDYISHELFHQWFGDLVTCQSWTMLSMNESFATFGEYLWREYKYGKQDESMKRMEDLRGYLASAEYDKQPIINNYYRDAEDLFDRNRYEKGGLVLNMLRRELGDDIFFSAIKKYLHARAFGTTDVDVLRMYMEEESGRDLKVFFNQWFHTAGHPDIKVNYDYDTLRQKLQISVRQLQVLDDIPVFRAWIPVHIYFKNKDTLCRIYLKKDRDTFRINSPVPPTAVVFDEGKNFLCRKRENKSQSWWAAQLYQATLYADKYEAIIALGDERHLLSDDTLKSLLQFCIKDSFYAIRRLGLNYFMGGENIGNEKRVYPQLEGVIKEMALHDASAEVRVAALNSIKNHSEEEAIHIYKSCMYDSSYRVTASAIEALFRFRKLETTEDTLALLQLLQGNDKVENSEVILECIKAYAKIGGADKKHYFHFAYFMLKDFSVTYFLTSYEKYLSRMGDDFILTEIPFILRIKAKSAGSSWFRLSYTSFIKNISESLRKNHPAAANEVTDKYNLAADKLDAVYDDLKIMGIR